MEYDEIAGKLDIAERTVKCHVSNILSKTGYANRTRLASAVTNKKFIVPNLPEERKFSKTDDSLTDAVYSIEAEKGTLTLTGADGEVCAFSRQK